MARPREECSRCKAPKSMFPFHNKFWSAYHACDSFEVELDDWHKNTFLITGFVKKKKKWLFEADVYMVLEPDERSTSDCFCSSCGLRKWERFDQKVKATFSKCSSFDIELCYERDEEFILTGHGEKKTWIFSAFMDTVQEFDDEGEIKRRRGIPKRTVDEIKAKC